MTDTHLSYHLDRAEAEDRMAERADDPATARAHRDLAAMHRQRAAIMDGRPIMSEERSAA